MADGDLPITVALAQLRSLCHPVGDVESLPLADAVGRALATDVAASLDLPPFDSAAMDGYAISSSAVHDVYRVIGEARAGHPFPKRVGAGEAVRIMTGAPMPAGADAVIMIEHAEASSSSMRTSQPVQSGMNVRSRAEHVKQGECVLPRGRRLTPADLGLAASVGCSALPVYRRLRVGLLSTGDELADAPASLRPGGIYDGNRPMLCAKLAAAGCEVFDFGIVADERQALQQAIERALLRAEVLITTGGAALGDADFVRQQPGVRFVTVNVRPGRGIVAGTIVNQASRALLLGLPGNGVAAFLMFELLAAPMLRLLGGYSEFETRRLRLPLATAVKGKSRSEWRRARLVLRDGASAVEPLTEQGSAMLRTLSEADALIEIAEGAQLETGSIVDVILLAAAD